MAIIDTLKSRIREKLTPEVSALMSKKSNGRGGPDIHDDMWAWSHEAASKKASELQAEPAALKM